MNHVYILRCADGSYYTGWTNDLAARLAAHNRGSGGAKYTRSRRPVHLVYGEILPDKGMAMKREAQIKKLSRREKEILVMSMQCGDLITIYDAEEKAAGMLPRSAVRALGLTAHVRELAVRLPGGGEQRGKDGQKP